MIRKQLILTGVVQGVGFRPNVVRIASHHAVTGLCGNDDNSVFIEAQGAGEAVDSFLEAVRTDLPPLATIVTWRESDLDVAPDESAFIIVASRRAAGAITLLPADGAICADCLADMADPANRRYRYPFTTCTNCGPRLSIIRDVPYDRPLTTMADFPMCDACREEYEDPHDRRYHAQPISCFDCGPQLWLEPTGTAQLLRRVGPNSGAGPGHGPGDTDRRTIFATTIAAAKQMLRDGAILAVKGIGGFTLMCDARNEQAVSTLRVRKRRPGKPLAVMAGSVAAAERIAELGPAHIAALTGREAPIVLAPMSAQYDLAPSVAPGLDDVGVMLPYAPLHRLLLDEDDVLVATSANSSDKPLTYRNEDARTDLAGIVDAILMHDRGIHVPVEDSVVATDGDRTTPIRRSRGFAPLPVFLGAVTVGPGDPCVLAVGAELKNTFALTRDGMAFMSAHIGDMGSLETQAAFEKSVAQMLTAHRRTPELVVVDKHPGYATHAWGLREAERLGVPVLELQHHHAHALSLATEHRLIGQELTCIVLDGTGYGDDGTIWGGEILKLDPGALTFDRAWHIPGFWLPGGDSAVRFPWKSAAGLLWEFDLGWDILDAPHDELALVRSQLRNQVAVVRTTSTGRLFDAVASLLGVCQQIRYEAQAAMELETAARRCPAEHDAHRRELPDAPDLEWIIETLIDQVQQGRDVPCLARFFHAALSRLIARALYSVEPNSGPIGFTGGVFANRLLNADLEHDLADYAVLRHALVPANDGGLALGQAAAGVAWLRKDKS